VSGYVTYVCDGGPHDMRVPYPECPNAAKHAPSPIGYIAWHEWMAETSKTHRQERCPDCGYWVIVVPKGAKGATR